MRKLYKKNELAFSLVQIIFYIVLSTVADELSSITGTAKAFTFPVHLIMSAVILLFLKKEKLFKKYGLCKTDIPPRKLLYFLPLILISTVNLWSGLKLNFTVTESIFYAGSMLCVGFIEEIVFRGFLFKAMAKDSVKTAVIVSSLTFGTGHIINLFKGSETNLLPALCQVIYATAVGYLFVIIFHKGKTLIPCILSHSITNALSVFADNSLSEGKILIAVSVFLCAVSVSYSIYINCSLKEKR